MLGVVGGKLPRHMSVFRWFAQARNPYMGSADSLKEYFDTPDDVVKKARLIAEGLTYSNHAVVFCGAGISTKSGIPDYRSSAETVLQTGPGKWESDDKKAEYALKKQAVTRKGESAWPNDSHQALAALIEKRYVSHIVSQNVDGLLYRAGVPPQQVTEMHGNLYAMRCSSCFKSYWRDWNVPDWVVRDHKTDRLCDCTSKSPLRDTIVYFGDSLHAPDVKQTKEVLASADFILVLGTSLKVAPSNYYVTSRASNLQKDKVAIVNLQKTNLHNKGYIEVHDFCDNFLTVLAKELHLPLRVKQFQRTLRLKPAVKGTGHRRLEFECGQTDVEPSYKEIESTKQFVAYNKNTREQKIFDKWPYELSDEDLRRFDTLDFSFEFLREKSVTVDLQQLSEGKGTKFLFEYDWVVDFKSQSLVN